MEIKTPNGNISNSNINFIIKPQALIKKWNQDLKLPQISNLDESIQKISNPYSNMTYTNENKTT